MKEIYESLHEYFDALEKESLPFATRVIRERTGLHMRDDNPDDVLLPPHMSKHRCYAQWCFSRGWVVKKRVEHKAYTRKLPNMIIVNSMMKVKYLYGHRDQ